MNKNSILPIFLVVFIDLLGVGILIPVMAPLFMDPSHGFLGNATQSTRAVMLGFLLGSYALAQFFGAPILGGLSDRLGRRKVLMLSIFGSLVGYILFGIGILTRNIPLIFASRLLDGFTGGNIAVAMSAISDISDEKSKAKNFGLVGMAFGFGFIIGPFIGGKLADSSISSWFNSATPFWFAAGLCALNLLMLYIYFKETLHTKVNTPISALTGFKNLAKAMSMKNVRLMFLVVFLYAFGFNFFTQFFQVLLVEKFGFTASRIGDLFAYVGLWIIFTQGILIRPIAKRFAPPQVMQVSLLGLSIALFLILIPTKAYMLLFVLPMVSVFNGLTFPNSTSIISGLAGRESQGEIMGINQSIQAIAMAIPPIISGFIYTIHQSTPIIVGGLSVLLAWIAFQAFQKQSKQVFHEV